jgi:hypothetical protein
VETGGVLDCGIGIDLDGNVLSSPLDDSDLCGVVKSATPIRTDVAEGWEGNGMKTIIAGSRGIEDYNVVLAAIAAAPWQITHVVSGNARGVDRLGERYAQEYHLSYCTHKPDWNTYGKQAGYLRNEVMANIAEALIAIWDGKSRGTKHMIDIATKKGLKVYVYEVLS